MTNIIFEIFLACCIIYGYIHEEEIIELEMVLKQYIERKWRSERLRKTSKRQVQGKM